MTEYERIMNKMRELRRDDDPRFMVQERIASDLAVEEAQRRGLIKCPEDLNQLDALFGQTRPLLIVSIVVSN